MEAEAFAATNTKAAGFNQVLLEPYETPFQALWELEGQSFIDGYINLQEDAVKQVVWPFRTLFDPPVHEVNAFTAYRQKAGLPTKGLRQPDLRECLCRGAMVASAGEQAGWHACAQGWPRLVSEGLGEVGHFEAAHELSSHPFSSAAALSHFTVFAINKVAEQGKRISEWWRKQKRHLRYRSRQLKPLTEKLMALADEEARHLFAQSHVAFVLYLCILMAHADVTYPSRCIMGFEVVGDI